MCTRGPSSDGEPPLFRAARLWPYHSIKYNRARARIRARARVRARRTASVQGGSPKQSRLRFLSKSVLAAAGRAAAAASAAVQLKRL